MYFKSELENSKGSDHMTDDIVPLFWSLQNYQGRTLQCTFLQIFTAK